VNTSTSQIPVIFISYRRADNEAFDGAIDRISDRIKNLYEAETGQSIEVFLDKDSIQAGEEWDRHIADVLERTTVFMPIITMRYFDSAECLKEIHRFLGSTSQEERSHHVLPLVLAGMENIRSDHPQEEVRLIAKLNCRNIRSAYEAGFDSGEWFRTLSLIVRDILSMVSADAPISSKACPVAERPQKIPAPNSTVSSSTSTAMTTEVIESKPGRAPGLNPFTVEDVRQTRFHVSTRKGGYACSEVDKFMDEVEQYFTDPSSRTDVFLNRVTSVRFHISPRGGYVVADVDAFVDRIETALSQRI